MTRDEHLAWAKRRALEYVEMGRLDNALTSFISDANKDMGAGPLFNPSASATRLLMTVGMMHVTNNNARELRNWITGWN